AARLARRSDGHRPRPARSLLRQVLAVHTAHAGLLAALAVLSATPPSTASAAGVARAQKATPPPGLNIVRVELKPRTAGQYATLEGQIIRAYDRAKAKVYWIGLQGRDATDVLYLNLADSSDAWERTTAAYQALVKQHAEIPDLQQRLTKLTQAS